MFIVALGFSRYCQKSILLPKDFAIPCLFKINGHHNSFNAASSENYEKQNVELVNNCNNMPKGMDIIHSVDGSNFCPIPSENEENYISEIASNYMFKLPSSNLGIFRNAAVSTDAAQCAEIAR